MKKLIAVPVVAVIAAVGAASAAGFVGGVSAGPVQSGDTWDLECAHSASVVEWGTNESAAVPYVDNGLIKLTDSECQGQAVHMVALKPDGTELARFQSKRLASTLGSGEQFIRLFHAGSPSSGVPVSDLNAVRITVDPGYPSMTVGGSNTNPPPTS